MGKVARSGVHVLARCAWLCATLAVTGCASAPSSDASPKREDATRAVSSAIVGGHLDTSTNGVVALAFQNGTDVEVFCSGTLIAQNLVLTARHCVALIGDGSSEQIDCATSQFGDEYPSIVVSADTEPQSAGATVYSVAKILEAPGSKNFCGYDVALLILAGSGIPSNEATPIVPVLDTDAMTGETFSAVGYGLTNPNDMTGTSSGRRMRADGAKVYCVGNACPPVAQNETDEWVGTSQVCPGDSGGPALDDAGRVFGVTSRGPADCSYALFSSVTAWASFINDGANLAATLGALPPPSWVTASDAGSSDASTGAPDAGASPSEAERGAGPEPPSPGSAPTVNPLGQACSGACLGSYQCFSENGKPPGICVPPCAEAGVACPPSYACAEALGVCVPEQDITHARASSCAMSRSREPNPALAWTTLLLSLGLALRRKKKS
ncbi:MAG TPA: S1 family peptidase [Polyangiaceae bacterium]